MGWWTTLCPFKLPENCWNPTGQECVSRQTVTVINIPTVALIVFSTIYVHNQEEKTLYSFFQQLARECWNSDASRLGT